MDLVKMIRELKPEKQRLDEAIWALERLSGRNIRRRGRPPKWLKEQIRRPVDGRSEKADEKISRRGSESR
jgi:hypothetical protein